MITDETLEAAALAIYRANRKKDVSEATYESKWARHRFGYTVLARAALEAAPAHMHELVVVNEFAPTRWWRAIDAGGNLLAETSDPRDFKSLGLSDEPGIMFQRMYEARSTRWVDEKP